MPIVIKPVDDLGDGSSIIKLSGEDWNLKRQLKVLKDWVVQNPGKLPFAEPHVADVGFWQRTDPLESEPYLTAEFMRSCADANLDLCFSVYSASDPDYVKTVFDAAFLQELKDARDYGRTLIELNRLYSELLKTGLPMIRNTLHGTDRGWALAQAEFLHEVPNLISQPKPFPHIHWWDSHRELYLEWMAEDKSDNPDSMRDEDVYDHLLQRI